MNADSMTARRPQPLIRSDRDVLHALGMRESDAAMYLGKSRQALNAQLGRDEPTAGYFRIGEIFILASAARQLGRSIPVDAIKNYIEDTRPHRREGASDDTFKLLIKLLDEKEALLETGGADAVAFILPAFADLRAKHPAAAELLEATTAEFKRRPSPPAVFVLSSTNIRAKMAGDWLGVPADHCFGRDLVDHYLPTVLVYYKARDKAFPYVLTEADGFTTAPEFVTPMIADCVRSMLPWEMRHAFQPDRAVAADPAAQPAAEPDS